MKLFTYKQTIVAFGVISVKILSHPRNVDVVLDVKNETADEKLLTTVTEKVVL